MELNRMRTDRWNAENTQNQARRRISGPYTVPFAELHEGKGEIVGGGVDGGGQGEVNSFRATKINSSA